MNWLQCIKVENEIQEVFTFKTKVSKSMEISFLVSGNFITNGDVSNVWRPN